MVSISCKEEFTQLQPGVPGAEVLIHFNTEEPGTDCKVRTHNAWKGKIKGRLQKQLRPIYVFSIGLIVICKCVCVCVSFVSKIPDSLRALSAERNHHKSPLGPSQYNGMQQGQPATEVWKEEKVVQIGTTSAGMLLFSFPSVLNSTVDRVLTMRQWTTNHKTVLTLHFISLQFHLIGRQENLSSLKERRRVQPVQPGPGEELPQTAYSS